ncbi:MAG: hypothetical protein GXO39_09710 [Thermotogae bacterium]|nr:hypothetical protein [Thermotogota bacterium]
MFLVILTMVADSIVFGVRPEIKSVFVPPPDYRLNVGDRILITAYSRQVAFVQYVAFVDNNGYVPLELTPSSRPDAVKLVGLTLDSAQKVLLRAYRRFVRSTGYVSIQLVSPAKFYVMLRGNFDTKVGGYLRVGGLTRLSDVVLNRKFVLPYSAPSRVVLNHDTFDLWRFVKEGDLTFNPFLKANDTIYLPRTDSVIFAVGDFSKGNFWTVEWEPGDRIYDVMLKLRLASRIHSLRAARINGHIVDISAPVNIGDTVSFDFAIPFVVVIGQVIKPGGYEYAPHRTVQDYIIEAYGFAERANAWDIKVKSPGSRKLKRVSLDYRPSPGDIIIVGSSPLTMRDLVFLGPSIVSTAVLIYTTFFRK